MNNYLQTDMPGLNGLLEKHKQMQERSAIKTQPQVLHTSTSVTTSVNPNIQPPNGLYHLGNSAMVPYPNSYFVNNSVMHDPRSYYNPNSMSSPTNNYFNSMLQQQPNNYFNPNPVLQTASNNFYTPNLMSSNQTNFLNLVPQNYINQNLFPQYNTNFFNYNHVLQFQNDAYIQNMMAQNTSTSSAQNFVLQCINGDFNRTPMSQCTDNNYNQNPVSSTVNRNFNVSQNVNNTFNRNDVNNHNQSSYDPNHQVLQNISTSLKNKVYWNPNFKKTSASVDSKTISNNQIQNKKKNSNNSNQDNETSVLGKQKIHVNPNFIPKLTVVSSVTRSINDVSSGNCSIDKNAVESSSLEKLQKNDNLIKSDINEENSDTSKENENSSIIILTKRKLVRVKKDSKNNASCINLIKPILTQRRRLISIRSKRLKINAKKISLNRLYNTSKLKYTNSTVKKVLGHSLGLISIDGVLYNKSRNQLIRSNSSVVKQKHDSLLDKSIEYYVAENGKKLLKLDIIKKNSHISSAKSNASTSPVKNYKANVSNKVKQRSLQILRDKMRKNNQPCLLYQKFGYCANQLKGTCPKVHDKKLIAVCQKFLQGKCQLKNCPLSHDVGPEKMPTCKYFLEGFCTREGCPYLHVKVSSKKPICQEFLRGYCSRGNECPHRHIIACPEFDKAGNCSKGKFCPYPHKSPLTETKRSKGSVRRKSEVSASSRVLKRKSEQLDKQSEVEVLVENKKRYYDESSEDLSLKRQKLLTQVETIKYVHGSTSESPLDNEKIVAEVKGDKCNKDIQEGDETSELVCSKPRRPLIGPLPAYIPIE